jgi:hypothetical protein
LRKKLVMKQKVIDVKYRKDSESFPDFMKYEITLLNEDGSTEKIPAYGKDLQDALSRVVHDKKVKKLDKRAKFVPWWGWTIVWFGYLTALTLWYYSTPGHVEILIGGIGFAFVTLLVLMLWGQERNKSKK